ncbi:SURF1 family protein [Vibrio mediterranei]|uniref:SURF1 family protein n=1 Tax=Vibrio mediterranei TaxID=689 RepID=UPI004068B7D0
MWFKSIKFWIGFVLTVVVFSALVNLGLWQRQRGDDKTMIETMLAERAQLPPKSLLSLEIPATTDHPATYMEWFALPVFGELQPLPTVFYLDNQTVEGRIGYLVLQLMVDKSSRHWLVELGFVAGTNDRQQLPEVSIITKPVAVTGRLYQKMQSVLGSDLYTETFGAGDISQYRVQNLNLEAMAEVIQQPLVRWVIQPTDNLTSYVHPWKPLSMNAKKHYGYAFQWFAMAFVFAGLILVVLIRRMKVNTWSVKER